MYVEARDLDRGTKVTRKLDSIDFLEMFEQAESMENLEYSGRAMIEAAIMQESNAEFTVWDHQDHDLKGVFGYSKLVKMWTKMAKEQGYTAYAYYHETSDHDAFTYSELFERTIFGEVVYG